MKKIIVLNYAFNPTAKTVTLLDYPSFRLEQVFGIFNVTQRKWIYDPLEPIGFGATAFNGNVITLEASTTGMSATDNLAITFQTSDQFETSKTAPINSSDAITTLEVTANSTSWSTSPTWLDCQGYTHIGMTPRCTQYPASLVTPTSIDIRLQWSAKGDVDFSYEALEQAGTVTGNLLQINNYPKLWTYVLPSGTTPTGGSSLGVGIIFLPIKKRFLRLEGRLNQLLTGTPARLQLLSQLSVR
jgi:hypothetical protein